MKNHSKIKLIAASVALAASFSAQAGIGGLNVQSHLNEPFSGSIAVTGDEAKALLNGGKVTVSDKSLNARVRKSGDKAVITVTSSQAVRDPVLVFQVGAGAQVREYTAIIDPVGYSPKTKASHAAVADGMKQAAEDKKAAQRARQEAKRSEQKESKPAKEAKPVKETKATKTAKENKNAKAVKEHRAPEKKSAVKHHAAQTASGKTHRVLAGETLLDIAAQFRPENMTAEQAMYAIIRANPNVFVGKNADLTLEGKVLHIPDFGTPKKQAQAKPAVPSETPAAEKPVEKPVEKPAEKAVEKPAEPVAPVVEPVPEPAPEAVPENHAASEEASAEAASAASEAMPQEEAASALDMMASATEETVSEPVAEPVDPAVETEEPGFFDDLIGGDMYYPLLAGGGGLLLLLLLLRLRQSKRRAAQLAEETAPVEETLEEDIDDDGIKIMFDMPSETDAPKSAQEEAGNPFAGLSLDKETEAELGKQPVFDESEQATASELDVNIADFENAQNDILSGALTQDEETLKRENADWDVIASTESVYEPEPVNPYNPVEIVVETPAEDKAETSAAASVYDVDFYNNLFEQAEEATPEEKPADEAEEPEETAQADGVLSFNPSSYAKSFVPHTVGGDAETEQKAEEPVQKQTDDFLDFDPYRFNNTFVDAIEGVQVAEEPKEDAESEPKVEAEEDDFLTFDPNLYGKSAESEAEEEKDEAEAEKVTADDFLAFDPNLYGKSAESEAEEEKDEAEAEKVTADDFLAFDPNLYGKSAESEAEAKDEDEPSESVLTAADFAADAENTLEEPLPDFLKDDDAADWNLNVPAENVFDGNDNQIVSESAGMDAPTEAKYELVKMYMEIGDNDAAAETLKELLEEAQGDALEKVKALAKELDI